MRITALEVQNYKRVEDIKICPDADRTVILIGGKNRAGKSSTIDALSAAFGGKKTQSPDPVRHGADEAIIHVEIDGGELAITRTIQPDGSSVLEVRDRLGAVKAPQALLDRIIGSRFLDPLAFLALPAKEQRATLMRLIDGADRIVGLDEKRGRAFDRRTEVGRDLTKAEGELARLPEVSAGTAIDIDALNVEARALADQQRFGDGLGNTLSQCERETSAAKSKLAQLNAQRTKLEGELEKIKGMIVAAGIESADWATDVEKCVAVEAAAKAKLDEAGASWAAGAARRAELDADLKRAGEHNRAVFAAEAQTKRRAEVAAEVAKLTTERENLTKVLDTIDVRKAEILGAAKLPVTGLNVTADGIELAGVPFAQASGAEKLSVALALAIAASPKLDDVWIRDGALLDEESLAALVAHAKGEGKRLWIERVSDTDAGVIVIKDGKILERK